VFRYNQVANAQVLARLGGVPEAFLPLLHTSGHSGPTGPSSRGGGPVTRGFS